MSGQGDRGAICKAEAIIGFVGWEYKHKAGFWVI